MDIFSMFKLPLCLYGSLLAVASIFISLPAKALTFNFSFSNDSNFGNTPGTVTGTIDGLLDNTANQPATTITITSYPVAAGTLSAGSTPTNWNNLASNSFSVSSGVITNADFNSTNSAYGFSNELCLDSGSGSCHINLLKTNTRIVANAGGSAGVSFTQATGVPEPSDILGLIVLGSFMIILTKKFRSQLAFNKA